MESHYVSQSGSRGVSKKAVLISALALVGLIGVFCVYNLNTTSFNVRFKGPVEKAWADWKIQQKKIYGGPEDKARFNIFKQNYALVHTHNAKKESYTLALNKFADLTPREFAALYTGATAAYRNASDRCEAPDDKLSSVKVPDTLDWRKEGRVGPVKNQARCGSCWAFSTTGALEGLSAKNGKIGNFSEQQLVDCTTTYGNQGCNGGWVQNAFHYIIDHGLAAEDDYPYKAVDQECKKDVKPSINIQGCVNVPVKSVDAMKEALQNGPIAVYVEASKPSFHLYNGGIVTDANCFADGEVDHAVLLVGYTEDAWIVKNSWSSTWGEEGYIRVSLKETADKNGICGILSTPNSYPL